MQQRSSTGRRSSASSASHAEVYAQPRISGEYLDCGLPVVFDTRDSCGYDCAYCFSHYMRQSGRVRVGKRMDVARAMRAYEESPAFKAFAESGRAVQCGGLGDPFDSLEKADPITLDLMDAFAARGQRCSFSTKGAWWTKDERYMERFRRHRDLWHVKFSIITSDVTAAGLIERGVPTPQERFAAMEAVAAAGVSTTLRLRPVVPGVTEKGDGIAGLIRDAANAGAQSVSMEFLCVDQRAGRKNRVRFERLHMASPRLLQVYRRCSMGAGYLRLNREAKRRDTDEAEKACADHGLRFYVSDAHFKERSHHGCCCGIPEHWKYQDGQFTAAAVLARRQGSVRWRDIAAGAEAFYGRLPRVGGPGGSPAETNGGVSGSQRARALWYGRSHLDYVLYMWDHPERGKSPGTYFGGGLVANGRDEDGHVVYRYAA